ncbi:MAG: branched-chain amino acid ABC transporter ATP-binding protein, partial [Rhodospirillales bacterium]|nr:branched-chain amino acid ABC transporter ATP-binding protein [Rhodospirillales bacterium]
ELFSTIQTIGSTDVSVLLVEQNARRSLKIAQRAYLLENGRIVGHGTAEELRSDKRVATSYLGL